jgi:hypothetical protein
MIKRLDRAAKTNRERDAMDVKAGFARPHACPPDLVMRTAVMALECALTMEDWDVVAEAADILAAATNFYPWRKMKP